MTTSLSWRAAAITLITALVAVTTTSAQLVLREGPEPNHFGAAPMALPLGAQVDGAIADPQDNDAFVLTLRQPTWLLAWTSPGPNNPVSDTVLELRDHNGLLLVVADDGPRSGPFAALATGLMPGTYHLVVRGARGAIGGYSLDACPGFTPPLLPEAAEPNGDPRAAGRPTVAGIDILVEGDITSGTDTDWFEFVLDAPQTMLFTTSPGDAPSLRNATLALFRRDARGQPQLLTSGSGSGGHTDLEVPLLAGSYWVAIGSANGDTGRYYCALQALATVAVQAGGCPGRHGVPTLDVRRDGGGRARELPILGSSFAIDGGTAPAGSGVLRLVGFGPSTTVWPLEGFGGPGCLVEVAPLLVDFALADAQGHHQLALPLPHHPRWRGVAIQAQVAVLDPMANALGIALSPTLLARCGSAS